MRHFVPLLIKYVFIGVATLIVLTGMLGNPAGASLWVAFVLTIALYLAGDMLILPIYGNTTATVADAGVALILTWIAPMYSAIDQVPFMSALAVALLIGIAEYFFHNYLLETFVSEPVMTTDDSE